MRTRLRRRNSERGELAGHSETVAEICQPVSHVWFPVRCNPPSRRPSICRRFNLLLVFRLTLVFVVFVIVVFLLFVFVLFLLVVLVFTVVFELTFSFDWLTRAVDDCTVLRARRRDVRYCVGTDDGAVLVKLDAPGERARALRRRYGAARGDVLLLVVRVLF